MDTSYQQRFVTNAQVANLRANYIDLEDRLEDAHREIIRLNDQLVRLQSEMQGDTDWLVELLESFVATIQKSDPKRITAYQREASGPYERAIVELNDLVMGALEIIQKRSEAHDR